MLQGWAKEWTLGCVNPTSWLPPTAGGEFTQPRAHSFAHLCTSECKLTLNYQYDILQVSMVIRKAYAFIWIHSFFFRNCSYGLSPIDFGRYLSFALLGVSQTLRQSGGGSVKSPISSSDRQTICLHCQGLPISGY